MCCHLALLGLAQGKPSWSAQACTGQAQAELDDNTCAVYPAPECTVYRAMKRKHPSFLPFSAFFLRLAFQSVVRSSSLSLSLCIGAFESVCPFWQTELRVTRRKDLSATAANCEKYARAGRGGKRGTCAKLAVLQQEKQSTLDCLDVLWTAVPARRERESATLFWCSD